MSEYVMALLEEYIANADVERRDTINIVLNKKQMNFFIE